MRIAVIGTGISGMVAAHLLSRRHDVVVYEAREYIGGHTHTIDVDVEGTSYAVDTGFIVFNDVNYPNLLRLFRQLGVAWQDSRMGFSVRCEKTGLEYRPSTFDTLFAQRRNLLRPRFWRMVREIVRFRRESPALLATSEDPTLAEYLDRQGYSRFFREYFLVPMGAAIWSAEPTAFADFPARRFIEFFTNHGLLKSKGQPQWRVVRGGSREYVAPLTRPYRDSIRLSCPVRQVRRLSEGVEVRAGDGSTETFDQVVLATHSDQALAMVAEPTDAEREILGAIPYQENVTVLHTDESLLPRLRKVWASWNYHILADARGGVAVTYDMNLLQGLSAPVEFCVSLNREADIAPDRVLHRLIYAHPVFTRAGMAAQARHGEISGANRIHYCGAYWGNGFHEDGVNSALAVGRQFGEEL